MTSIVVIISEVPSTVDPRQRIRLLLTVKGYVTVRVYPSGRVGPLVLPRDSVQAYHEYLLAEHTPGGVQFCSFNGDPFLEPVIVHDLAAVAS
jgi:hypothetical protein